MIQLDKSSLNNGLKVLICAELFSKVKDGAVNDEIIVFAGKDVDVNNILSLTGNQNCKVMDIESYDEYDLRNTYQNIILTANNGIPFNIIKDSNKKFLIVDAGSIGSIDTILQRVANYEKFNIKNNTSYSTYAQKRDPLELIFKDTQTIIECLSIVLESTVSNIRVQKDSISFFKGLSEEEIWHWKKSILLDIDLLEKQRVLTFKLAKVICIIAIINDNVSDEEVYSFCQKYLGVLKYNNAYKEFWELSDVR
mgnify:FL=1